MVAAAIRMQRAGGEAAQATQLRRVARRGDGGPQRSDGRKRRRVIRYAMQSRLRRIGQACGMAIGRRARFRLDRKGTQAWRCRDRPWIARCSVAFDVGENGSEVGHDVAHPARAFITKRGFPCGQPRAARGVNATIAASATTNAATPAVA